MVREIHITTPGYGVIIQLKNGQRFGSYKEFCSYFNKCDSAAYYLLKKHPDWSINDIADYWFSKMKKNG